MALTVKISSALRGYIKDYDPHQGLILDMTPGENVDDLLTRIGIPVEKVKIVMVNGLSSPLDKPLSDGDRVGLFPPVGGG